MSAKKRFGPKKGSDGKSRASPAKEARPNEDKRIDLDEWVEQKRPVRQRFDGPQDVQTALRISFDRPAYADIVLHAKESLDKEIYGVLVGKVCEDDEGLFVSVKAAIKGKAVQQDKSHVTLLGHPSTTLNRTRSETPL